MSWKPVYTKENEISVIRSKIDEIAYALTQLINQPQEPSLFSGFTGIGIFLFHYGRYKESQVHLELGNEMIERAVDMINQTDFSSISFAGGISGICWGIQHLIKHDFIEADQDELFAELDEVIINTITQQLKSGNFDYLHGGTGPFLYLLNRQKDSYTIKLGQALGELENSAIPDEAKHTVKWISHINEHLGQPVEVYNLSLSHGISSVINMLSRYLNVVKNTADKKQANRLFTRSLNYLMQHQNKNTERSFFPLYIFPNAGEVPDSSKLAWCYGDLGVGISLLVVALRMKDDSLKQYSLNVLKKINEREYDSAKNVVDAGLCHGTCGIGHIYQRIYNYTEQEEFKQLARVWFDRTLDFANHINGLAGYKASTGPDSFKNEPGLLEGVAGIGLSLLSAISDTEPTWDECLLLS